MYGSDSTQAAALAATGTAGAVLWTVIGSGVLILAGLTIITIIGVIRHRTRNRDELRNSP